MIETMSPDECRKHNLTQLVALLQTKEKINKKDALDEDALNLYKNMINAYFNKHKNIFQYTDAALELKLLSEDKEYRTMVENFIKNQDGIDNEGSKYDLEKSQNKKSDLIKKIFNQDDEEKSQNEKSKLIKKIFNQDYEISNMDQSKKIMSQNILHPNQIQEAYKASEQAKETIQNRGFWLRLLDSILDALTSIDFFHILPQSSETKKQNDIIAKNEKIIKKLNDTNNKITENLITNFDKLLQDEQDLANKTTEISKKIEQIKELEENMKSDQLNSYLAYLTDGVNNIIDNLYSNNSDANELKNAFQGEINKKKKKGYNEQIKACKKFLHENLNLSVNGGIKTTLLNTPKKEIAAKLNNIVEQMYGNTDQATKQKTKDFLEKNFNNDNENAKIVFLSEVNESSKEEIEKYSHYNVKGDIAMIHNQGIKEAECNKNPLGIEFKTDVQIVEHDGMTIYHMHNTSNAGEKKQLNSFTEALGRSEQLGIMVGDFNYGFNNDADRVMVIEACDPQQSKLNDLAQLLEDMEKAGKTMIYLQPYQNIDMTRGAQPGNQQSAIKVNIEKKPDNNGILLNKKFLQEMKNEGNTINFKSTDKKEVLGFDHNTANLDIIKNGQKTSLIVQNLFNDRSEKNNKVYSNIANVTNQDALNNFNGNVSGLFYENSLKYLSSSQQQQSIKEKIGDKNARDKVNFKSF